MPSGGRAEQHARGRRRAAWSSAWAAAVAMALASVAVAAAVSLQVSTRLETAQGVETPTSFLTHFQFVGTLVSAIPGFAPPQWSHTVGTPSRLPRGGAARAINAPTGGHEAVLWDFNETVGMTPLTEVEIQFSVTYVSGGVTSTFSTIVYVESGGRALTAPQQFGFYWDAGATNGVTPTVEVALALVCSAVGTCP
jgi:hypothetical protein